jgi:hypothetical protein
MQSDRIPSNKSEIQINIVRYDAVPELGEEMSLMCISIALESASVLGITPVLLHLP